MPESYKPTAAMASAARRAKKMRDSQPPSNQGMTRVGLERMNQLIDREPLSLETVKRMYSFFSRHEVDKQSKSWKEGDSKAEQAWLGWGGDAGYAWSRKIVEQQERENNMQTERAQLVRAVNKSQIIKHAKGWTIRDVVPVVDDIVMNGGLYPAAELNQSYESLEGVPAPIGHPRDEEGGYISGMRGEALRNYYAGVTVENARKEGDRVLVDLEINEAQAMAHPDGQRMIDAINSGQSVHVSTGLLLQRNQESGISRGKRYSWRATNMQFDHLAILLDEPGAATPEDGVGIMANSAELYVNLDEYESNSMSQEDKRSEINDKIMEKFADGNTKYAWVESTYDDYVIYRVGEQGKPDKLFKVGYEFNGGEINLIGEPAEVERSVSYLPAMNSLLDKFKAMFVSAFPAGYNANHAQSMPTSDSGDSDMTPEEVKELVDNQLAEFSANMSDDMKALKEENEAMKKELNAMKKKYEANEAAELEAKVNRAVELTGKKPEDYQGMAANALDAIIELAGNQSTAYTINGDLPAGGKQTYDMPE